MNSEPSYNNELTIKKPHREYPLPNIKCPFHGKLNRLYGCPETKDWQNWVYGMSNMTKDQFNKLAPLDLMYAYVHPFCVDKTRYQTLIKQGLMYYVWDDHTETSIGDIARDKDKSLIIWGQFGELLDKIEGKHVSTSNWRSYVFGFYSTTNDIYCCYNASQKKRMIEFGRLYMGGNLEETKYINEGKPFENLDQFMKIRFKSCGMMIAYTTIEFTDNLVVPDKVWAEKRWQRLIKLAVYSIIYVNDLFSFEKEFKEAEGDLVKTPNIVAVISLLNKVTIAESMLKVNKMLEENDTEFIELGQQIINETQCHPMTKDYINALYWYLGGHYKACRILDRYN